MPEVKITLELAVQVEDEVDPLVLERSIATEGRRAARGLYLAAMARRLAQRSS